MKKSTLLALCLAVYSSAMCATDTARVLFIGNSYVQVNNLPDIIARIAADRGDVLIKTDVSVGGSTLQNHRANTTTLAQIAKKGWDYVILQEQSQLPAFPDAQVAQDCYPYARQLDSLVHLANPCAKTVFYMTWGRKNGDAGNCASFPLICTYDGMDSLLRSRYTILAQNNKALLAPVGVAWHKMRDTHPATDLYQPDESHPSEAGSYLAACTFYTIIFRKDPTAIIYGGSLSAADAANIRQVVKTQVWDSLAKWYRFTPAATRPVAAFTHTPAGRTMSFTNTSLRAIRYQWSFGDGAGDTATSPVHTYAGSGVYMIRLIAANCDGTSDTLMRRISAGTTGISPVGASAAPSLHPNPASDMITLVSDRIPSGILITDVYGRACSINYHTTRGSSRINIAGLPAGIYLIRAFYEDGYTSAQSFTINR